MRLKRPLRGSEHGADVRMVQRALNRWVGSAVAIPITSVYDQRTRDRMVAFQLSENVKPADGSMEQATLDRLTPFFDRYGRARYRLYRPPRPVPKLGPIVAGGVSVLAHSLTHETDGVPGYPAFDDGWIAGKPVLAPEHLLITEQSGSQGGDAFYARGESSLRYWIGHVEAAPGTGRRFKKGEVMAHIAWMPRAHVHLGIDAEPLIGHELIHHTDYTHGAPTVGEQLRRALV